MLPSLAAKGLRNLVPAYPVRAGTGCAVPVGATLASRCCVDGSGRERPPASEPFHRPVHVPPVQCGPVQCGVGGGWPHPVWMRHPRGRPRWNPVPVPSFMCSHVAREPPAEKGGGSAMSGECHPAVAQAIPAWRELHQFRGLGSLTWVHPAGLERVGDSSRCSGPVRPDGAVSKAPGGGATHGDRRVTGARIASTGGPGSGNPRRALLVAATSSVTPVVASPPNGAL